MQQEGRYIDSFIANRPFGDVARTVKRMSDECLNFSLTIKENGIVKKPWGYANTTFSTSPQRAELHFQRKIPGQLSTYHEKGMYYLVADMIPAGPGKTKVDVYYWDDVAVAAKAIRGWATGALLTPRPGYSYVAKVRHLNGLYAVDLQERSRNGSVRNLERIPLSECKGRG